MLFFISGKERRSSDISTIKRGIERPRPVEKRQSQPHLFEKGFLGCLTVVVVIVVVVGDDEDVDNLSPREHLIKSFD